MRGFTILRRCVERAATTRRPAQRTCATATHAAVALATLSLISCGGGGGGSSPTGAVVSGNYLPLDAHDRWLYSANAAGATDLVAVVGTQSVNGQSAVVVQDTNLSTNAVSQALYMAKSDGIWQYPGAGADVFTQNLGPIELMQLPLVTGASFVQIDKTFDSGIDFDGDGRTDQVMVHSQITVVGAESVSTAAGTFANSLHLHTDGTETVLYSSGIPSVTVTISADDWYAPDVGPVHSTSSAKSSNGSASSSQDVVAYRTAANHSTPPTVQSVAPTASPVRGYGLSVTAAFSETMDVASLNAGGFTVVDASALPVAGTVQMTGPTAVFAPTAGWVSGSFTARIGTGAQDLVGNPVQAGRTWSFDVDATGPSLVSSTPAADAHDVPLNAQIVLQFSEPLDPTTVSAFAIQLTDQTGAAVPDTVMLSGGNSTVTLTPTAPLQLRTSYTINVSTTVSDVVGNQGSGTLFIFRTVQGRFAAPAFLVPPRYLDAAAIGDVNGDGINDVVLTADAANPASGQYSVFMLAGQADGSLGPPIGISGATVLSYPSTVAIGDLNGDGRQDVAVGVDYGGIQIYLQAADGSFAPGDFLNTAYAGHLRIADLNGDGRMDLVSVGGGGSVVNVWLQDLTGHLIAQPSLSFAPNQGARDVEVGDINGDGRPDVIVTISGYYAGQHAAVFLQQPDGSFAAPSYLTADPNWGATGVAIGDLNGDGRNDVVLAGGGNTPTFIYVYYQAANGTLGPAVPVSSYDIPTAVRLADINGDGRKDVIVSHNGWGVVGVYLQQSDGSLAPEVLYDAPYGNGNPQSMAVGDVNRDGMPDIVIGGQVLIQKPPSAYTAAGALPGPVRVLHPALRAATVNSPLGNH